MQSNSTIKSRLNEFLKYLGIGQAKFAENVGLSRGFANNVGDSIRADNLAKITSVYPELNTVWLITGEGKMLKNSSESSNQNFTDMDIRTLLDAIQQHGEELRKQGERLDRILDLIAPTKQSQVG